MKTYKSVSTFAVLLLTGLQVLASDSAVYLSAKQNESALIERVDKKGDDQYKIYLRVNGKFTDRIVTRAELAFPTKESVGGHTKGQWALATNPENNMIENCQISEVFENGTVTVYCNSLVNGGTMDSEVIHSLYSGTAQAFVAEVNAAAYGIQSGEILTLTKENSTIKAGERVKFVHAFANRKALVHGKGNRFDSLVDITDLQK